MNVISNIDLEVSMLNKDEITYQITLKILKDLLNKNTITQEEYEKFKIKMIEKYNPKITYLTELSLDK